MLSKVDDKIRYQGLGAGRIIRHEEREFQGQNRIFAVILFPHRSMTVQLPIGDPAVTKKISRVLGKRECQSLVNSIEEPGRRLSRTWDQREEQGLAILRNGTPQDWAELLKAYATARGEGLAVAASDADLIRSAQELIAAELCAACGDPYPVALHKVVSRYQSGVQASRARFLKAHPELSDAEADRLPELQFA